MTNKEAFAIADAIAIQLSKDKLLSGHLRIVRDIIQKDITELHLEPVEKKKKKGLNPTPVTDEELRSRLREHLLDRLEDGSLSASEIGQLKDVFNLASKTDNLVIQTIDFRDMCSDCPKRNAPAVA